MFYFIIIVCYYLYNPVASSDSEVVPRLIHPYHKHVRNLNRHTGRAEALSIQTEIAVF